MTPTERHETLHAFASGSHDLLLATDAASEGLNLHHRCRLVVNLELPWTPLRLEQRVGRVDRIGQQRRVHAIHLIAKGTAEEDIVARLFDRSARASAALSSASSPLGEGDVANCVFDGSLTTPESPRATTSHAFLAADLREPAHHEADRVITARALHVAGDAAASARPVLTACRRRSPGTARCYWVFRASFADTSGHIFWSTLMAISAVTNTHARRSPQAVRSLLDPDRPVLRDAVEQAHAKALADVKSALRPWVSLALRREQDIAEELERTRARLAARQPGLFDRRADRAAGAQTAILTDALSQCTDRLGYLARLRVPARGAHALVFAIALE
jgi:hypothetical protein